MSCSDDENYHNDFQEELDNDSDRNLFMDFIPSKRKSSTRYEYYDLKVYKNLLFCVSRLNNMLKLIFRGSKYVEKIVIEGTNIVIENRTDKKLEINNLIISNNVKDNRIYNICIIGNVQINNINSKFHKLIYLDYIENSLILNIEKNLINLTLHITGLEDLQVLKNLENKYVLSLNLIVDDFRGYFDSRKITNRNEVIPIEFSENLFTTNLEINYSGKFYKKSKALIELKNLPNCLKNVKIDQHFQFIFD